MSQSAAGAAGLANPQVVALIECVSDERVAVAAANVRFEAALAKSDLLGDDDSSTGAKRIKDKTLAEEARLSATRGKLQTARADLAAYGVAIHGASAPVITSAASAKIDDDVAAEKKELRLLKRKLPAPKDGWKDTKGATISVYTYRHLLYQQLFEIFWKLREVLRQQAAAAPDAINTAERALGVKWANLRDPEEFEDKLETMTVCHALELGLNQLNEVGYALYIRHKYNQAVVDNFLGDEYVGAERKQSLKERMAASVKEMQKLSQAAKTAVGIAGGPYARKSRKGGRGGGGWKQPAKQPSSLPPGFDKPKPAAGGQLGGDRDPVQCFKCKEMGHVAAMCPNK
jgi:hypothetical protein